MEVSPEADHLERFVTAQDAVWSDVLAELAAGDKRSHWMWFVFPQLRGLGHSPTAKRYGLASLSEARAYAAHPVLGARLLECARLLDAVQGRSALDIFGPVDAMKLRSCLTLFERAVPQEPLFSRLLDRYAGGVRDAATLGMLAAD